MSVNDFVVVTTCRETGERVRLARPTGIELLSDVRSRVMMAQGLIEDGNVGEALSLLYDLEDDLEASVQP